MNLDAARRVADTVLYEGYVLYPYRASAQKNRSRWQFGVLMPAEYVEADPSASAAIQTECVLEQAAQPTELRVLVRFLQAQRRTIEQAEHGAWTAAAVLETAVGPIRPWDEAVEHEIELTLDPDALGSGYHHEFTVDGAEDVEVVRDPDGAVIGRLIRRRTPLVGTITVTAESVPGPWRARRLRVRVENRTPMFREADAEAEPDAADRDAALPAALLAAHTILGVSNGAFVSMFDPPEWAAAAVAACQNIGAWPVLAGPEGDQTVVLSASIILYDHVNIAPESPGDMYDGTEIDEILALRTLALSDAEKREARATDPRAAAVIDRVDAMDATTMRRLHGAIRSLRAVAEPESDPFAVQAPWWDPGVDASVAPSTDAVEVAGHRIAAGSRVLLRPGARRSDAQDMFLAGRAAVVEAVLLDVDDNRYLAVTLADDPGADLQRSHGRYLYFNPDEVQPL